MAHFRSGSILIVVLPDEPFTKAVFCSLNHVLAHLLNHARGDRGGNECHKPDFLGFMFVFFLVSFVKKEMKQQRTTESYGF